MNDPTARFDRFDVCGAYAALEADWNVGGWLHERPSNRRRRESIGVQLRRIGYSAPAGHGGSFEALQNDNERAIYCGALARFGLSALCLRDADPTHRPILDFMRARGIATGRRPLTTHSQRNER